MYLMSAPGRMLTVRLFMILRDFAATDNKLVGLTYITIRKRRKLRVSLPSHLRESLQARLWELPLYRFSLELPLN